MRAEFNSTDETDGHVRSLLQGIASEPVAIALAAMLLIAAFFQGFTGFYLTYLAETRRFDEQTAAMLYGLFFVGGIVVQPLAGSAADAFSERRTLGVPALTLPLFPLIHNF